MKDNKLKKILVKEFNPIDINEMRPVGFHKERYISSKKCHEKVEYGDGWNDVLCCPVCHSTNYYKLMNKYGVDIVQCNQCTLGYCLKIPKNLNNVYSDAQYLGQAKRDYEKNVLYRMERFAKERVGILRKWLDKKQYNDCTLLDIGCGTGWFLEFARKEGFIVFGQEIGSTLAAYTENRLGIKIWSCYIDEIENNEYFDAITMFDVLEHSANPSIMISNVRRLLKPEGIAVIYVPNLHSVGFSVLLEESALVSPVEHLLYFTEKSIRFLSESNGMHIMHIETKGMDIPDMIAYFRDKKKDFSISDFLIEYSDIFQSCFDESGKANHMRVILRKHA